MKFEKLVSKKNEKVGCPNCKKECDESNHLISRISFNFKGGAPSQDSADVLAGLATEKGWETVEQRTKIKNEIRRKEGTKFLHRLDDKAYSTERMKESYTPVSQDVAQDTKVKTNAYIDIANGVRDGKIKTDSKGRVEL